MKIIITILLLIFAVNANAQKTKPQPATLSFEAALIMRNNSVSPVRRTTFLLLDAGLNKILTDAGLDSDGRKLISVTYGFAVMNQERSFLDKAQPAINSHVVARAQTDFEGKGIFEDIKVGSYYVIGYTEPANASFVIWNLKVNVKTGENKVLLDQYNAEAAF